MITRREAIEAALSLAALPSLASTLVRVSPPVRLSARMTKPTGGKCAPAYANLVTVVYGTSPATVRARACDAARSVNTSTGAEIFGEDWKAVVRNKVAAFTNAPSENTAILRNTTEGVTNVLLNWSLKRWR